MRLGSKKSLWSTYWCWIILSLISSSSSSTTYVAAGMGATTISSKVWRSPWTLWMGGALLSYGAYNIVLNQQVQQQFLVMQIVGHITCNNHKPPESLPYDLIKPLSRVSTSKVSGMKQAMKKAEYTELWSGSIDYTQDMSKEKNGKDDADTATKEMPEQNHHPLLADGWYKTIGGLYPKDNKENKCMFILVKGDGQKATIYIPPIIFVGNITNLFISRKPCSMVEQLVPKLMWQQWLQSAITKPSTSILPGAYSFHYREYVNYEEKIAMITGRGGLAPFTSSQDSKLVLLDNGDCYLEDHGRLLGIIPIQTHNEGVWVPPSVASQNGESVDGAIQWKRSSLRIGFGNTGEWFGKTTEIQSVTKMMTSAPWPIKKVALEVGNGNDSDDSGTDTEVLLIHRPDKGWLIFEDMSKPGC